MTLLVRPERSLSLEGKFCLKEQPAVNEKRSTMKTVTLSEHQNGGCDLGPVFSTLQKKAKGMKRMGQYAEALAVYEHMLSLQRERLSVLEAGDGVLRALQTIPEVCEENLGSSNSLQNIAILDHCEKAHFATLAILHKKAGVLDNMERYDEALSVCREVLMSERLPGNHRTRLRTMCRMAAVLESMCRYDEALKVFENVLRKVRERDSGKDDGVLVVLTAKVYKLMEKGKREEAIILLKHIVSVQVKPVVEATEKVTN